MFEILCYRWRYSETEPPIKYNFRRDFVIYETVGQEPIQLSFNNFKDKVCFYVKHVKQNYI